MRLLLWLAVVVPSLAVAISTGRVVASLDAPVPVPLAAAIGAAVAAAYGLDHLISTLLARRAAHRG